MTDILTALSGPGKLEPYKGRDVLRTSISIRNAGDGLSAAMKIDPIELEIDDRVFVVLECVVTHHDHGPIKDTDCLELKQVLRAEAATLVDEDVVRQHLDDQAMRIERAKDAVIGRQKLPTDEELDNAHLNGEHADALVDECLSCQEESDAEEREREAANG